MRADAIKDRSSFSLGDRKKRMKKETYKFKTRWLHNRTIKDKQTGRNNYAKIV